MKLITQKQIDLLAILNHRHGHVLVDRIDPLFHRGVINACMGHGFVELTKHGTEYELTDLGETALWAWRSAHFALTGSKRPKRGFHARRKGKTRKRAALA